MSQPKKLFLLDAMALIYRAYFALNRNPRINSKGLNTSAVLGFANTLLEIIKKEKPTHIAVAFDTVAPTQRHADFAEYKAHREEVPEDIILSIPLIKTLIEGFNIPVIVKDGYEADDIIGTLAKKAEKEGFQVFMMTPDKDFGQLVSENIFMYKPARMGNDVEIWGVKEVCERFGIEEPMQLIDILGLWGDASDNIPGVPGIGGKKAKKLIADFKSIENLLQRVDEVAENRSRENLREFGHQALLSKSLATIILNVPVDLNEEQLRLKEPNAEVLIPLFEELEFRTLAKRVFENTPTPAPAKATPKAAPAGQMDLFADTNAFEDPQQQAAEKVAWLLQEHDFQTASTSEAIDLLLEQLTQVDSFCFDTETTSLESTDTQLVGIAFCIQPGQAWFVPFPENEQQALELAHRFKPLFENPAIGKTGQNIKFDINVLKNYGIQTQGKLFDTMLAHYLLQPDMRHNMDVLAETYLNYKPLSIEALIGKKGKGQKSMRQVPLETLTAYACEDAHVTLQLKEIFEPMLTAQNLSSLFEELETPLVYVLSEMEGNGVKIDTAVLQEYAQKLAEEIATIEQEIYALAGTTFNIASPKQLGAILFDRLKLVEKAKKTKTKQYSTSEDVLSKLAHKHEIIQKILDYRSLTKLKSTYVDVFPLLINARTGRLHASFNQAVAATGRLSSNNPNLQNIPIRTEQGREIRKAFVTGSPNALLLAADYSQIELRIIASLSGDEAMMEAFRQGLDIHAATAAKVYEVELEQVTREMRRNAKMVNFGIVYGISAFGLSERLNIPRNEAATIIDQYFAKYPGIARYMEDTIAFARQHLYVETMMGRRRYINDINSSNGAVRGYAERNAINSPVQGSAADLIKLAMIRIHRQMKEKQLKSRMILQVHDELVFEVEQEELEIMKAIIAEGMQNAIELKVPLEIDMNTGQNWLEAH